MEINMLEFSHIFLNNLYVCSVIATEMFREEEVAKKTAK
jgi:hypothetical protein